MTNDLTPLEKLDDAIRSYVEETVEDPGMLAGWVLVWQEQSIGDEPGMLPLQWRRDITMGASTSPEAALGLLDLGSLAIHEAVLGGDDEDD